MLKTYKIEFLSFASPIRAYTLFGAICWAYRLSKGEENLITFLKEFKESPKFFISSPFPIVTGCSNKTCEEFYLFPKPVLPLSKKLEIEKDVCKKKERKNYKKAKYVTENVFREILEGKILEEKEFLKKDEYRVFEKSIIYKSQNKMNFLSRVGSDLLTKNIINRVTSTSNNLFTEEGLIFDKQYFFVKFLDTSFEKEFNKLIKIIENLGIGKNKNVGWGKVSIDEDKENNLSWIDEYIDSTGKFITLSPIIPTPNIDIKSSFYEFEIYKSPAENSFLQYRMKQKVIYLKEGSLIAARDKGLKGQLKKVAKEPEIYQYGLEFPLKVKA